jgi:hypothetical protein
MRFALVALCALSLVGTAHAQKQTPVKLGGTPDAAVVTGANDLAEQVRGAQFPHITRRDPALARQFLWLAATHPEPEVVAAALDGMGRTFARRKHKERPTIDENYRKVVRARLGSKAGVVQMNALRAARLIIGDEKVDAGTLSKMTEMAEKGSTTARIAAIRALGNVRDFQIAKARPGDAKAKVVKAILPALGASDTTLQAIAADRLGRSAYPELPERAKVLEAAKGLLTHKEAAVRAPALMLAARLAKPADAAALAGPVMAGLADADPFVRAAAAEAAATLKMTAAAHALVGLLDDAGKAMAELRPKGLDGKKDRVVLRPETSTRVDEVALYALESLSAGLPAAARHKVQPLSGRDRDDRRTKAVEAAKAWYAAHKGALPPAPAAAAAPAAQ